MCPNYSDAQLEIAAVSRYMKAVWQLPKLYRHQLPLCAHVISSQNTLTESNANKELDISLLTVQKNYQGHKHG